MLTANLKFRAKCFFFFNINNDKMVVYETYSVTFVLKLTGMLKV
jgi:hypothetical protein